MKCERGKYIPNWGKSMCKNPEDKESSGHLRFFKKFTTSRYRMQNGAWFRRWIWWQAKALSAVLKNWEQCDLATRRLTLNLLISNDCSKNSEWEWRWEVGGHCRILGERAVVCTLIVAGSMERNTKIQRILRTKNWLDTLTVWTPGAGRGFKWEKETEEGSGISHDFGFNN